MVVKGVARTNVVRIARAGRCFFRILSMTFGPL